MVRSMRSPKCLSQPTENIQRPINAIMGKQSSGAQKPHLHPAARAVGTALFQVHETKTPLKWETFSIESGCCALQEAMLTKTGTPTSTRSLLMHTRTIWMIRIAGGFHRPLQRHLTPQKVQSSHRSMRRVYLMYRT